MASQGVLLAEMKNDRFRCENLGLDHDPIHTLASGLVQRAAKAIGTCLVTRCGGRGARGEGDEVAAEDGDGRGKLLVATLAAEHRHDLAMTILDVDKCEDHVDRGSRR